MPNSSRKEPAAEAMDQQIRTTCKILEAVAKTYPQGSAEREALRQAADSFIYLRLHQGLRESYEAFQRAGCKPLSKAQLQVLKRMGVPLGGGPA